MFIAHLKLDCNVDLSNAVFHVTMYRQFARKVGASANSALIRYYLPRLKLSSSTIALARERTPSIHKMYQQFQPMVWPNLWDAGPVIVHFIIEFTSYRDALQWRGSNIKKLHMLLQYIIDNFWWQVMWWRKLSRTADDQSLTGMKLNMICLHVCAMLPFGQ